MRLKISRVVGLVQDYSKLVVRLPDVDDLPEVKEPPEPRPRTHKAAHRLSREDVAEMVRLYQEGVGSVRLAEQFRLGNQAVRQLLRNEGVEIRKHQHMTPEQAQRAVRLYVEEGYSLGKIARALNVPQSSIRRRLLKKVSRSAGEWIGGGCDGPRWRFARPVW